MATKQSISDNDAALPDCNYTDSYKTNTNELIADGIDVYLRIKLPSNVIFKYLNDYCLYDDKDTGYIQNTENGDKYIYVLLKKNEEGTNTDSLHDLIQTIMDDTVGVKIATVIDPCVYPSLPPN